MKGFTFLSLAAVGAAFVIPDEQAMNQVALEAPRTSRQGSSVFDKLPSVDRIWEEAEDVFGQAIKATRITLEKATDGFSARTHDLTDSTIHCVTQAQTNHDHKPNKTVYELISSSKYTTKLTEFINEYPDVVELLNGTAANYTVFAPIDKAFEKIPEHAPKPSKEELKQVLLYHVSDDYFPAGRVLVTHTIPTLHKAEAIGGKPQRLGLEIGLRGLTVNFYDRIIAINIFGTNGVIHGVESIILPPPTTVDIVTLLPGEFSTLELGLTKTGLIDALNDTSTHVGGTLFAPSNFAFQKLGPKINAFLFSPYGLKYLKALLKYHVVANQTLYSDAFYKADEAQQTNIPKGLFHVDLPTLLEDKALSVDVARYGGFISIKINGFSSVTIEDGIARDGVIQVVSNVLIPPKHVDTKDFWMGEELSEDDLKHRLEPFVDQGEL